MESTLRSNPTLREILEDPNSFFVTIHAKEFLRYIRLVKKFTESTICDIGAGHLKLTTLNPSKGFLRTTQPYLHSRWPENLVIRTAFEIKYLIKFLVGLPSEETTIVLYPTPNHLYFFREVTSFIMLPRVNFKVDLFYNHNQFVLLRAPDYTSDLKYFHKGTTKSEKIGIRNLGNFQEFKRTDPFLKGKPLDLIYDDLELYCHPYPTETRLLGAEMSMEALFNVTLVKEQLDFFPAFTHILKSIEPHFVNSIILDASNFTPLYFRITLLRGEGVTTTPRSPHVNIQIDVPFIIPGEILLSASLPEDPSPLPEDPAPLPEDPAPLPEDPSPLPVIRNKYFSAPASPTLEGPFLPTAFSAPASPVSEVPPVYAFSIEQRYAVAMLREAMPLLKEKGMMKAYNHFKLLTDGWPEENLEELTVSLRYKAIDDFLKTQTEENTEIITEFLKDNEEDIETRLNEGDMSFEGLLQILRFLPLKGETKEALNELIDWSDSLLTQERFEELTSSEAVAGDEIYDMLFALASAIEVPESKARHFSGEVIKKNAGKIIRTITGNNLTKWEGLPDVSVSTGGVVTVDFLNNSKRWGVQKSSLESCTTVRTGAYECPDCKRLTTIGNVYLLWCDECNRYTLGEPAKITDWKEKEKYLKKLITEFGTWRDTEDLSYVKENWLDDPAAITIDDVIFLLNRRRKELKEEADGSFEVNESELRKLPKKRVEKIQASKILNEIRNGCHAGVSSDLAETIMILFKDFFTVFSKIKGNMPESGTVNYLAFLHLLTHTFDFQDSGFKVAVVQDAIPLSYRQAFYNFTKYLLRRYKGTPSREFCRLPPLIQEGLKKLVWWWDEDNDTIFKESHKALFNDGALVPSEVLLQAARDFSLF